MQAPRDYSRKPLYFTVSDRNFLPRTLSMCKSLRMFDQENRIIFFAIEPLSKNEFLEFSKIQVEILQVDTYIGLDLFIDLKTKRSLLEFVWTLPSLLLSRIMLSETDFSDVTYLDADIYFYSDPSIVWEEVKVGNVSVVPHNFSDRLKMIFQESGDFNVSWVSVPNTDFGLQVSTDWATKCLEICPDVPTIYNGRSVYGDQKYLDYWPMDFGERIQVIQNVGVGVAPWNYERLSISKDYPFLVNQSPLIFYHFSSHQFGFRFARMMGSEYSKVSPIPKALYKYYENDLLESVKALKFNSWKSRFTPFSIRTVNFIKRKLHYAIKL